MKQKKKLSQHMCNLIGQGKTMAEAFAIVEGKPQAKAKPKATEPPKPTLAEQKAEIAAKIEEAGGVVPTESKSLAVFAKALADTKAPEADI